LSPHDQQVRQEPRSLQGGYRDNSRLCQSLHSDLRGKIGRYNHNPCRLHKKQLCESTYFFQIVKEQPSAIFCIRNHT